jgi:iron complex transport system ATP-binding protein
MLRTITDAGRACIVVSHDVNLALTFCTRIVVLAERSIACDMPIEVARSRDGWLALFSPRLQRARSHDGRSWICYR